MPFFYLPLLSSHDDLTNQIRPLNDLDRQICRKHPHPHPHAVLIFHSQRLFSFFFDQKCYFNVKEKFSFVHVQKTKGINGCINQRKKNVISERTRKMIWNDILSSFSLYQMIRKKAKSKKGEARLNGCINIRFISENHFHS